MVEAANLESRLSFEPPAPPPVDQTDDSRDSEATQSFEPAPVSAPAPATDSVDLSDAARAIAPAPETTTNIGPSEIDPIDNGDDGARQADQAVPAPTENAEPLTTDDGVAAQPSLQTAANEPITPDADNPLESNQDSSLALEEAGNDTLNETEAGRTLGQVIDVFA